MSRQANIDVFIRQLNLGLQDWRKIPWPLVERETFSLQKRIYQASKQSTTKEELRSVVHRLQRLLMSSWFARCLAVRRVTQDNQGKRTAGIDGVASITPT